MPTYRQDGRRRSPEKFAWFDMRVLFPIIVGFVFQTAVLVGTGLWWGGRIETKQDEHSRRLLEHDVVLRAMSASQERIVRLETITERLERITGRFEDRINGARR